MILEKLKIYLEDNIKFEEASLSRSQELSDQIYRSSNLTTFRRILKFLEVHDVKPRD
jgi:hypothetical protein